MEASEHRESICFVSTYPPTVCGLASYTSSLLGAVAANRGSRRDVGVVDLAGTARGVTPDVAYRHRTGDATSLAAAVRVLNSFDAVSLQHEYGIYGGPDGVEVLDLVAGLSVPVAVTFHTVLDQPSTRQRAIIDELARHASVMIVMSRTGADRLTSCYGIDPERIEVLPHGADAMFAGPSLVTGSRPLVLTWGLIGPGKGLETAIAAFGDLVDLDPRPRYLIAGATHPLVLESSGESYRQGLLDLVGDLGLQDVVEFDARYLERRELAATVRRADMVVLPYASVEQVTSGVLVEAIAAAKPVIATRFPHAVELLSSGAGATVPHADAAALSSALRLLLTDRALAADAGREARRIADGWYWPTIGRRFDSMMAEMVQIDRLVRPRPELRRVAG